MAFNGKSAKISAAKSAAYCAVCCAVLIAGQLALSAVSGVEIVTVLLLSFSAYFGVLCGVATAVSFALLRCVLFGFNPAVIVLYVLYYPAFAATFGLLGKIRDGVYTKPSFVLLVPVNSILLLMGGACAYLAALKLVKVSRVYAAMIDALLWVNCGVCFAILIIFNALFIAARKGKINGKILKLFLLCAAACAFTVAFTLLDDVITPLFYAFSKEAAAGYFYASFTAMLPQVLCCAISVFTLYPPVTFALTKACPRAKCIDKCREK